MNFNLFIIIKSNNSTSLSNIFTNKIIIKFSVNTNGINNISSDT